MTDQVLGFGCQSLRQYTDNDLRNFEIWCWGPDSANLGSSGSLETALRAYDSEFFSTVEGEMCCSDHEGFFCNTLFVAFVGCWFLDRRNEFEEVLRMLVVAMMMPLEEFLPKPQVWLAGTSIRALPLTWWVWEISNIARLPILEVLSSCVLEMERLVNQSGPPKWGCKGQRYTTRRTNMTMEKTTIWRCNLLLNMVMFHCHVSFRGSWGNYFTEPIRFSCIAFGCVILFSGCVFLWKKQCRYATYLMKDKAKPFACT